MTPQCVVCDRPLTEGTEYDVDLTGSGQTKAYPIEPVITCASCEALCCKDCISPKNADLCAPCAQCDGCGLQFAFDDLSPVYDTPKGCPQDTRLWLCHGCRKTRLHVVAA